MLELFIQRGSFPFNMKGFFDLNIVNRGKWLGRSLNIIEANKQARV